MGYTKINFLANKDITQFCQDIGRKYAKHIEWFNSRPEEEYHIPTIFLKNKNLPAGGFPNQDIKFDWEETSPISYYPIYQHTYLKASLLLLLKEIIDKTEFFKEDSIWYSCGKYVGEPLGHSTEGSDWGDPDKRPSQNAIKKLWDTEVIPKKYHEDYDWNKFIIVKSEGNIWSWYDYYPIFPLNGKVELEMHGVWLYIPDFYTQEYGIFLTSDVSYFYWLKTIENLKTGAIETKEKKYEGYKKFSDVFIEKGDEWFTEEKSYRKLWEWECIEKECVDWDDEGNCIEEKCIKAEWVFKGMDRYVLDEQKIYISLNEYFPPIWGRIGGEPLPPLPVANYDITSVWASFIKVLDDSLI